LTPEPFSQPPSSSVHVFDPSLTINSGQMFLWEKIGQYWYGTYGNHILKFSESALKDDSNNEKNIEFSSLPEYNRWQYDVFRLDDDINKILSDFSRDILVSEAIRLYPGLRIMRQQPEQCMLSFVCASNTNILMIRRMLKNLSRKFGAKLELDGREFFTFPTAERINRADNNELRSCGLGYRTKSIKNMAKNIVSGEIDIKYLKSTSYHNAKKNLMRVYGIGNKIADCILLFSLEKLEAFPIDVWIARTLFYHYGWQTKDGKEPKRNKKLSTNQYNILSETAREYFGKYSGYAQQYLYYHIRESAHKNW